MRCSVVVPFQISHKPAPKGPKQLQRTLDDHPILTIAVTFINSLKTFILVLETSVGVMTDYLKEPNLTNFQIKVVFFSTAVDEYKQVSR